VAAFLTPPDAISQCAMAIPMYLLYEFGIVMSRVMLKAKVRRDTELHAKEKEADA
jgi:sec-independent protein translocase protein TatC